MDLWISFLSLAQVSLCSHKQLKDKNNILHKKPAGSLKSYLSCCNYFGWQTGFSFKQKNYDSSFYLKIN